MSSHRNADSATVSSDVAVKYFSPILIVDVNYYFVTEKKGSDLKAERQVIGLVPCDQRQVERALRPPHTSTTFYLPGPVVSNRVDCIVNLLVMSTIECYPQITQIVSSVQRHLASYSLEALRICSPASRQVASLPESRRPEQSSRPCENLAPLLQLH